MIYRYLQLITNISILLSTADIYNTIADICERIADICKCGLNVKTLP